MGILTSGQITVRVIKVRSSATLEAIAAAASSNAYPIEDGKASTGWGSSWDDDAAVNVPLQFPLDAGRPQLVAATDNLPARLRLRFYWDTPDRIATRAQASGSTPWERINFRHAADLIVLRQDSDRLVVLISSRDVRLLKAYPVKYFESLVKSLDEAAQVQFEGIDEAFDPDFFMWLLYKLNQGAGSVIDQGVRLESITELSSRDRQLRGARFTENANMERVELAALIVMGKARFGPAKIGLAVDVPDASFEVELHLDGGFKIYRSSEYSTRDLEDGAEGHALVEDFWSLVHPRLRSAYSADRSWTSGGRSSLKAQAASLIRSILP